MKVKPCSKAALSLNNLFFWHQRKRSAGTICPTSFTKFYWNRAKDCLFTLPEEWEEPGSHKEHHLHLMWSTFSHPLLSPIKSISRPRATGSSEALRTPTTPGSPNQLLPHWLQVLLQEFVFQSCSKTDWGFPSCTAQLTVILLTW